MIEWRGSPKTLKNYPAAQMFTLKNFKTAFSNYIDLKRFQLPFSSTALLLLKLLHLIFLLTKGSFFAVVSKNTVDHFCMLHQNLVLLIQLYI